MTFSTVFHELAAILVIAGVVTVHGACRPDLDMT